MPVAIDKPSKYFNTKLYTGTGASRSITGVGFKPDLIWTKSRNDTWNHCVVDAVRGALKVIRTETTEVEETRTNNISSFDTDGYSIAGADGLVNANGDSLVSWNWLASNTTVSNTAGTRTSTVSVNTTSGFSIVSYTGNSTAGATIGHGLGVKPSMIITKQRSGDVAEPVVYHIKNGATKGMKLNTSDAVFTNTTLWNDTEPTSTLFTVGTSAVTNASFPMIAYCFAEIKGYSKFGSYTGNGSADGTFVYTGFKPAFVLRRRTDSAQDWLIQDNRRTGINQTTSYTSILKPNSSGAELAFNEIDILSNGFKCRASDTHGNASGGNYIYMAFADNPFVSSKGIPTTAR